MNLDPKDSTHPLPTMCFPGRAVSGPSQPCMAKPWQLSPVPRAFMFFLISVSSSIRVTWSESPGQYPTTLHVHWTTTPSAIQWGQGSGWLGQSSPILAGCWYAGRSKEKDTEWEEKRRGRLFGFDDFLQLDSRRLIPISCLSRNKSNQRSFCYRCDFKFDFCNVQAMPPNEHFLPASFPLLHKFTMLGFLPV